VTSPLLAHASGFSWDEALLVLAPLVVIGGLLGLANRRAARLNDAEPAGDGDGDEPVGDEPLGDGADRATGPA
jgi:hypothetical protein